MGGRWISNFPLRKTTEYTAFCTAASNVKTVNFLGLIYVHSKAHANISVKEITFDSSGSASDQCSILSQRKWGAPHWMYSLRATPSLSSVSNPKTTDSHSHLLWNRISILRVSRKKFGDISWFWANPPLSACINYHVRFLLRDILNNLILPKFD